LPFDNTPPLQPLSPIDSEGSLLIWKIEQCVHDGLSLGETLARLPGEDVEEVRTEFARLAGECQLLESLTNWPMDGTAHGSTRRVVDDEDEEEPEGRLNRTHLVLAVEQCIHQRLDLEATQDKLWREDPKVVEAAFARLTWAKDSRVGPYESRHGLHAERVRDVRRPQPVRKRGLTLAELAERAGMDRETLAALMEHHGYVETVPFGGKQRRVVVSDQAIAAGHGHNVDASRVRVAVVEGHGKASVFPVFYPEWVSSILRTLDLDGIAARAAAIPGKKERLCWLMETHGFLPNAELARLSGYSLSAVEKARTKAKEGPTAAAASGSGYLTAWVKARMPR
jgi:hypothetical protein